MVAMVWQLDLQLPVQSVPISTKVPVHKEVYQIQHYVIKFVSVFSGHSGFLHDITEMLLKVALDTITLNPIFKVEITHFLMGTLYWVFFLFLIASNVGTLFFILGGEGDFSFCIKCKYPDLQNQQGTLQNQVNFVDVK